MSDRPMVLIIEDNPRNLKLARDVLNHAGYETLEAENAEDGLASPAPTARRSCSWTSSCQASTAWRRSGTSAPTR